MSETGSGPSRRDDLRLLTIRSNNQRNTTMTTEIMTYEQQKQARLARKQEREWQKRMAEAKVYDARQHWSGQHATLGVRAERARASLIKRLAAMDEQGRKELARFAETLQKDLATGRPCHSFEWSASAFDAAAQVDVATRYTALLTGDEVGDNDYSLASDVTIIGWMRDELAQQVYRSAKWPARSTSQQSNLTEQAVGKASADLLEMVDNAISFYQLRD